MFIISLTNPKQSHNTAESMATLDPKVTTTLDASPHTHTHSHTTEDPEDEDALIASLEASADDDPGLAHLREKRLQQLHTEFQRAKQQRTLGHGTYDTITDNPERSVLDITTSTNLCIVHFFRDDFRRCRIMDGHLASLAERHLETRFVRVNVDAVPFLVERLKVRVLPCVIGFVGGKSVERVIGFEGVGKGGDGFGTRELEVRLVGCGVLERVKMERGERKGGGGGDARVRRKEREDVDDDEWD